MSFDVETIGTEYVDKLVEIELEREEKEIYAAWRAGYDYLHRVRRLGWKTSIMYPSWVPANSAALARDAEITYDLRDEALIPEARKALREYEP